MDNSTDNYNMLVTNPAIDPLREGLVISFEVNIGKHQNILEVGLQNATQVILSSPILNEGELDALMTDHFLNAGELDALMTEYLKMSLSVVFPYLALETCR
ncbi:hypothetical protein J5N97_022607 [Dioscorea zingiberensis]|uniref:Glutamate synthase central-N domain-containing protein n=1 Tax=Dioscorea zingiberensis TaxID=325984 RepID=A0A9D5CCA2_9LILI|nr:hypothetical protein J5N97_022607 [Dioscorea zingiberensis]